MRVTRFKRWVTWNLPHEDLTPLEIGWLGAQDNLRRPSGSDVKPVHWAKLCERMAEESYARLDPAFRPLAKDTIGFAWNFKIWRFSGQLDEFPVFDEQLKWKEWPKSDDGLRWKSDNS